MSLALAPHLRWKQRIATSPLAGPAGVLRGLAGRARALFEPELALLHQEPRYIAACLRRMVRPDWTCLDVGGHLGSVAWMLSRLAPRGRLAIVEPAPDKAEALRLRFPRATVHQVAVGDRAGEAVFHENLAEPAFSSLSDRASRGQTRTIRVALARIDDLWPASEPLHLLKIDVEGHEPAALRGAEATLRRHRPVILFEAGAEDDPETDAAGYAGLHAFLTGLGYAIRPAFHQFHRREAIGPEGFAACRRYPFTAFNFFATDAGGAPP